ncbi:F-box/LRR-repeat protein 7-like isoform X2 [Formica exsecta]|uniref:F-box/LRR-repeat protein 7-like isoform X2 n=1 Tax=Formica exsecta TaxID=72781 RepID=UPI00114414C2|nr:F-box/LRR-repeat protein 7-like isoform X2 [Formica exsecta]
MDNFYSRRNLLTRLHTCILRTNSLYEETIDGVPIRKLFVDNLADRTTFKDLRNCFSVYGNIENCYLRRNQGKKNYAFVTFTRVEDAMAAMQDGSRKQIRLHNRDLRVMAADSWHQPDSVDQKLYNIGKESNKTFEKKTTNEQYHQCLQNDVEDVSIHILNDDCLRHIFLFLPIIDRVRIERVCKRWRDLSQDSWRMMKTLDLSPSTWGFLETHTIRTATLRKVLLKCGKFLTQINLSDTSNFLRQSTLTIVGKLCPNLMSIDVTALTICASGIGTLASNCKNITRFSLGPSTYSCDNELKNLFKVNNNLEYLAISKNNIAGKSLLCLPAQTIHTIILDRCDNIQDNLFSTALKKLENLKHLTINNCSGITVRTLKAIGVHCKSLNELEIEGGLLFAETADVLHLTKLVNLKVLKFIYNPLVSDEFLINLAQQCQQLIYLDITGSLDVTDIGLAAIATLPKLEQLIINYVKKITDNGLENMCGLKNLECRKCTSISDQGMSMFIRSSPYLQLLDISGCHNISNITLDAAKDACNTRSNNVMLKMIIGNTSIFSTKEQDEEQTSPLLQIVNVDLCDDDFNMLDIDEEDMSDEDIYDVDDDSWIDEDSDYDYSYENEDLEPDNIYF